MKGSQNWHKGKSYDISSSLIRNSVLRAHGALWAKQRPILEKGMSSDIFESAVPKVLQTVNELCDKWERIARDSGNRAEVEVPEEALKLTLDVS